MANSGSLYGRPGIVVARADATAPLVLVWAAWFVLMTGVNLATPLYAVYAEKFGFSSLVLTAVFTVYAFVLVPSLLVFGRLSDRVGRRPVVLAGLVTAAAGLLVFAMAQGTAWLVAARVLQGLAVGLISAPATAALVEFEPDRARTRPALLAGLAQAGGSGTGPLVAGVLAQWAPDPLVLPYLAVLASTGVAAWLVLSLPEPAGDAREPWRIQRPRVPAEIRAPFARVSLTAATVWAAAALSLSIVPSYSRDLLRTDDLALIGAVAALGLAASCAAQAATDRLRPPGRQAQAAGLGLLAGGLVALVAASPLHSLAVLGVGSVAIGLGHGLGYLNAQHELNEMAPAARRGEVTSAFVGCIYALVASAVIGTGLLDGVVSLATAVGVVALALAAVAGAAAVWQLQPTRNEVRLTR
jgi:MFS family permease